MLKKTVKLLRGSVCVRARSRSECVLPGGHHQAFLPRFLQLDSADKRRKSATYKYNVKFHNLFLLYFLTKSHYL